jgi:LuxR family transcriptional regulator, maltose regulon positive regulatory protein
LGHLLLGVSDCGLQGLQRMGPGRGPYRPGRHACASGRDRGEFRDTPGLRAASPHGPAPGRCPGGARELVRAQHPRRLLTYALPHLAVQARIELARAHLALADLAGARTLMREVDDLLRRRPGLGTLVAEAGVLRAQLASQHGSSVPGASALTAAELRLLPLLSTHLSFPEIAEEMFLSRHTIKSQAVSIYRKLGASSCSQSVTRARELGLLES